MGILQNKADHDEITIKHDVLEYIALQVKDNIRALEGSLNRVVAYSKLLNTAVTPEIAGRALCDIASKEPKLAPITPHLITETVAGTFQLTLTDLRGRRRDEATAQARQICMYLMRQETECSLSEIGRELGDRSPATISYAYEKMSEAINNNPQLKRQVFNIQQKLLCRPQRQVNRQFFKGFISQPHFFNNFLFLLITFYRLILPKHPHLFSQPYLTPVTLPQIILILSSSFT